MMNDGLRPHATMRAPASAITGSAARYGLGIAIIATALPILLISVPPLLDYPNHLARFWLLSGGDRRAPTDHMYQIDWSRSSVNIGLDMLFATIGRVTGSLPLARCVLLLALMGPPIGAVLLNRVLFARWHAWQIAGLMLTWTTTALFGFLSYQVSLALALFAVAGEARLKLGWMTSMIVAAIATIVILVFHPFGVVFYFFLSAALAIGPSWTGLFRRPRMIGIAVRVGALALMMAIVVIALLLLSPHPPTRAAGRPAIAWDLHARHILLVAESPFLTYRRAVDAAFLIVPFGLLIAASATKRLHAHAGLTLAGLALALLSLIMPSGLGDASWVTLRLPLMAVLALFAAVQPEWPTNRIGVGAAAALLLAAALGRAGWIGHVWSARERDVQAVRKAEEAIPAGAAVFAVQVLPQSPNRAPLGRYLAGIPPFSSENTLRHVPALVVPERRAFLPTLFAVAGQQPLRVRPPWNSIAVSSSRVPDVHVLDRPISEAEAREDPYLDVWRTRFDYVVVIGTDHADADGPFNPPPQLVLIRDTGFARLYRIKHPGMR